MSVSNERAFGKVICESRFRELTQLGDGTIVPLK